MALARRVKGLDCGIFGPSRPGGCNGVTGMRLVGLATSGVGPNTATTLKSLISGTDSPIQSGLMIAIIIYLAVLMLGLVYAVYADLAGVVPSWLSSHLGAYRCVVAGGFGGLLYLTRAIYLNRAVKKNWDSAWHVWYYLRPAASLMSGGVAYVFLSAGLLVLGAQTAEGGGSFGFIALSFVAGLNVDRFIDKIEDLAQAAWGIKKSRTSGDETGAKES